jgi:hypothetical protein
MSINVPLEVAIASISILFFGVILIIAKSLLGSFAKGSFVLSTLHAISMLGLTGYTIFVECAGERSPHCHFDSTSNSDFQQLLLLYSLGYFVVDSFVVLWLAPDVSASLHHTSILVGQIFALTAGSDVYGQPDSVFEYRGSSGYPLACFLFAAELSAPFLNAFLSGFTKEGSRLDFAARASFALTFIGARLMVCPFLCYEFVLNSPNAHVVPRVVCLFVMGISAYWSGTIFTGIRDALFTPPIPANKLQDDGPLMPPSSRVKGE